MYCVKCGVRLQEHAQQCPLCGTPVWNPEMADAKKKSIPESTYSSVMPRHNNRSSIPAAALLTVLMLFGVFAIFIICNELYGKLFWGGYAIGGMLVFYVAAVLPLWFRHPNPVVFVPSVHAAACVYLLYLCLSLHGHWFLSFAFPLTGMSCLLNTVLTVLFRYLKKGRMFLISGMFFAVSGMLLLIEFFEHITFGTKMFLWSLYAAGPTAVFGIFFLIAALVKPLKETMKRWFYI